MIIRKPKLFFETAVNPPHLTFNAGEQKKNLPWLHYAEARWDAYEPDFLKIEIGEWLVLLRGYNLGPLFAAIEEHTLQRLSALPDLEQKPEHIHDTFVVEIRFVSKCGKGKAAAAKLGKRTACDAEGDGPASD